MPLTHRQSFLQKHGLPFDTHLSIEEIAEIAKVPIKALYEIRDRGYGAHHTNPESVRIKGSFKKDPKLPISMKLSASQWALARIYSFLQKGKDYYTADADIAKRYNI